MSISLHRSINAPVVGTRILPGIVYEGGWGRYIKGVVEYASSRVLFVVTDSKLVGNVNLIGETYIYCCERCRCTVYEQEVQAMRQHDIDSGMMIPRSRRCPFCNGPIERLARGAKLRLHYRFAANGSSGAWWGERWEW